MLPTFVVTEHSRIHIVLHYGRDGVTRFTVLFEVKVVELRIIGDMDDFAGAIDRSGNADGDHPDPGVPVQKALNLQVKALYPGIQDTWSVPPIFHFAQAVNNRVPRFRSFQKQGQSQHMLRIVGIP
ncbi:hypothetical protein D3C73_1213920 [compost metagenome]